MDPRRQRSIDGQPAERRGNRPDKVLLLLAGLALTAVTSARGETLSGIVLTEEGTPAKGARVWCAKIQTNALERVETKADDQGRFALEVTPGPWLIDANLDDQGNNEMTFTAVQAGKPPKPRTLRLSKMGRLRVRLLEAETGKPIAGGRFVLDNGLDPAADQDGRLEIAALSRRRYHEAFVVAPGRFRQRILFEMSEGPVTDLELRILRGSKAAGRVIDTEGKPIPGAYVGRSTSGSMLSLTGLWTKTDQNGRFVYDGIEPDRTIRIHADAAGYESKNMNEVQIKPGIDLLKIEFQLKPKPATAKPKPEEARPRADQARNAAGYRKISGIVVDPDNKPVAGVKIRWGLNQTNDTVEADTDAEGKFLLAQVPDEPKSLGVMPRDGSLAAHIVAVPDRGNQENIRISLSKGRTAKGVIQNDAKEPFEGVMVTPIIGNDRSGLALWNRSAKSDARGRFEVNGLPESGVLFVFLRDGVSDLRNHPLELDKENVVTMSAAGAILGRVIDHEGKPVRNFRVLLNAPQEQKPDDKFGGFFAGFCGTGLSYTSDEGYFVIRNLGEGSVQRVTVLAPGHGELSVDRVIARPLVNLDPKKSSTYRLPEAHALKIRAADAQSGKPIPNAVVSLVFGEKYLDNQPVVRGGGNWGDSLRMRTDDAGIVDFSPLTYSEATVVVEAEGYAPRQFGWRDHAPEVHVELKPTKDVKIDGLIGD